MAGGGEDRELPSRGELERALEGSAPGARPEFRDELRGAFVQGRGAASEPPAESLGSGSQAEEGPRTPGHAMPEHILNRTRIADPAREDFRQDLRARFVAGELEDAAPEPAARRSSLRLLTWAAPLAVAAAILLIVNLGGGDASWRVRSIAGDGPLVIDGVDVASFDGPELERRIRAGQEIETGAHRVDLELGRRVRMRFEPGSRVRVEPSDGEEPLSFDLLAGELHGVTGPDFESAELRIETPRGTATITGTAFSILAVPQGACFCVGHGTVGVTDPESGRVHSVGRGSSIFLYAEGGASELITETELGHFPDAEAREEHMRPMHEFLAELAY